MEPRRRTLSSLSPTYYHGRYWSDSSVVAMCYGLWPTPDTYPATKTRILAIQLASFTPSQRASDLTTIEHIGLTRPLRPSCHKLKTGPKLLSHVTRRLCGDSSDPLG